MPNNIGLDISSIVWLGQSSVELWSSRRHIGFFLLFGLQCNYTVSVLILNPADLTDLFLAPLYPPTLYHGFTYEMVQIDTDKKS